MILNNTLYKLNDEFHITLLFTGGKEHEKCEEMESQLNKTLKVSINKIAVSNDFITIGVDDLGNCSYYGNPVKHITVGIAKYGKKLLPKDSPSAFENGAVVEVDLNVNGIVSKCLKQ